MKKFLSSDRIKAEALRLGFSACGLAPAEAVDETVATAFRQWLADGCQAEMAYMQNYEDKRLDPRLLVEGARTVISVALNYYPAKKLPEGEYQIAWYAYGKDYHDVMKAKLKELFEFIEKEVSFSKETDSTIASTNNIGTYTENYASAPQAPVSQTSASPLQGRIFCPGTFDAIRFGISFGTLIWIPNSIFMNQSIKTSTRIGIRQDVTSITAIVSIN